MVSKKEMRERVTQFLTFSREEIVWLCVCALVSGFIFSFRDWGGTIFSVSIGLVHFFLLTLVAFLSFLFRFGLQKHKALSYGYLAEYKVWWVGLVIMLLTAFITMGKLPVVLIGCVSVIFMSRSRLGEFRYGFSYGQNAQIALAGVMGNLILTFLFGVLLYLFPGSYLFEKGMWLNISMAFFALLPLVQLDGLSVFFGDRAQYVGSIFVVIVVSLLVATQSKAGLIFVGVVGAVLGVFGALTQSNR